MSSAVIVLIGGGHSAGKHTVCQEIKDNLSDITHLTTHTIELESDVVDGSSFGPSRYDFPKLFKKLEELESSKEEGNSLLVLIPGLYALFDRKLRQMAAMKVFVDCDADTRLNRWIVNDVLTEGKELGPLLEHYLKQARPEFNEFIHPTKEFADVVLPSEQSGLGVSLICDGITPLLTQRPVVGSVKTLYPRFGLESDLNIHAEKYDKEKNQYYDLS